MVKPKFFGSVRKVILDIAADFVEANADLEAVSFADAKRATKVGDFTPLQFICPQMDLTLRCKATVTEGKVKLFGLTVEGVEDSMEIEIKAPIIARPLNTDQLELIAASTEELIVKKLRERGIEGVSGDYFIPDTQ